MITFNPENQTYSKLIHIDEFPEMQKKMEQIAERVKNAPVFPANSYETDAEIYRDNRLTGKRIYGKKYLIMSHQGLLKEKGVYIIEGQCYAIDGPEYVRYCTLVKGITGSNNEDK